jgi:hypothetical protein
MLGPILRVLHILAHFYFITMPSYPHFTDEETEAQRLSNLLKVTQLIIDSTEI